MEQNLEKLLRKYSVYQLKQIFKTINTKQKLKIKLSKLTKKEIIQYLIKYQQYIISLHDVLKLHTRLKNILQLFNTKPYTDEEH